MPWMPTAGDEIPIQRVPSGLPGPGRDRLRVLRPVGRRRVPPRVAPLDDDLEAAERRRVARLPGGDSERAPQLHPVVEIEPVRARAGSRSRRRSTSRVIAGATSTSRAVTGARCASSGCGRARVRASPAAARRPVPVRGHERCRAAQQEARVDALAVEARGEPLDVALDRAAAARRPSAARSRRAATFARA